MTAAMASHPWLEARLAGPRALPASPAAWLNARRGAALERANALTVPTTRDEEWRFTDITPLTRLTMTGPADAARLAAQDISDFAVPEAAARLVFVDGFYAPDLSVAPGLPAGIVVSSLAAALGPHATLIEPHLAQHADVEHELFAALNTAHLRDGAFVRIPRGVACPQPIEVLHVATQKDAAANPRLLVLVEAGAECTLIENYAALADGAYFTNGVTEIAVGDGARLRHVRVQRESRAAFHIATCAVSVAHDAEYASHSVSLGARISRFNLHVAAQGEGASCRIDGLALIGGRQLADTHTSLDHRCAHTTSLQLHKTIVRDAAHAVFNGKVLVRPGAQLTNSAQESRNLILSPKAHVDTKPQLEIFADDVKCAHGATVGQLDAEHVFYLKSRGLTEESARNLLTYAFGAEVIGRIPVPSLVNALERVVLDETQVNSQ